MREKKGGVLGIPRHCEGGAAVVGADDTFGILSELRYRLRRGCKPAMAPLEPGNVQSFIV
jgi:hypothetical protein